MDGGRREAKSAMFDGVSAVARALASGRRGEIVDVLAQGERSVEQLGGEIAQSVANTSHHLQVLARAGLVSRRRAGTHVYYRLASDRVAELWATLRAAATDHVKGFDELVSAYLGDREGLEALSRDELVSRLDDDDLVVLDVRPPAEYEAGHIPGAWSVPIERVRGLLETLPRDVDVVAYCRGPHCVLALDAVRTLAERGVRARPLQDGFPEWRRAGLPTRTGRPDGE